MSPAEATREATPATPGTPGRARPLDAVLLGSLVLEAAAVAILLVSGLGRSGGTGIGSVLTPLVLMTALVPAPALQLALALARRVGDGRSAGSGVSASVGRRLLQGRFGGIVVALLGGCWILLAAVVSLATSGGVVWF
jgi:hypothetical protein